jgi:signal transduction histidine kinase
VTLQLPRGASLSRLRVLDWRKVCIVGAFAFAAIASTVAWQEKPEDWWLQAPMRAVAASLIGLGGYLWRRQPDRLLGRLLVACGASAFIGSFDSADADLIAAPAYSLNYLYTAFAVHIALVLPDGRLRGRFPHVLVAMSYVSSVGTRVMRYVLDCPPRGMPWPYPTLSADIASLIVIVISLTIAVTLTHRWLVATRPMRRMFVAPGVTAILWSVLCAAVSAANLLRASDELIATTLKVMFSAWLALVVGAYGWYALRVHQSRWRLATIAFERDSHIDAGRHPVMLQRALAVALEDPNLQLVQRLDDNQFVDVEGLTVSPIRPGAGLSVTPIERDNHTVGLIIHDQSLARRPELVKMAAAAAGVVIEQVASRKRLTSIAMEERWRIQRDVHDGAQQRLLATAILLDIAQDSLKQSAGSAGATDAVSRAQYHLADGIRNLRELTLGSRPQQLQDRGLAAALEEMCHGSPVPVLLDVPACRWRPAAESTAYLVVAEGLANVFRHADASLASVRVRATGDLLRLTILDDGGGGAVIGAGSGLRGLQERVRSVGGRLRVDSPPGWGTRICVELALETP